MVNCYNPHIRIKCAAYTVILCNYLPRMATGSCVNHAAEEKKKNLNPESGIKNLACIFTFDGNYRWDEDFSTS